MFNKYFILSSIVFCFFSTVSADILHFRSGTVCNAELTRKNIQIAKLSPLAFPKMPQNKIYAIVSIKLADLRTLSIFDYSLEAFGVSFPCVAIWKNGIFEYTTESISGSGIQQMLFVLDASLFGSQTRENLTLRSNLGSSASLYNITIPFSVIDKRQPAAPATIPAAGLLKLEEE